MGFSGGQSGISGASDVALSNPTDAHLLSYNATTSKWSNRTVPQVKSDLSIANVDNTSDANKPVSNAQASALGAKANDASVVHLTGNETITGVKNFTGTLQSNGQAVITSLSYGSLPAGTTLTVVKSGSWPARPTARTDIVVQWKGPDPSPSIVGSGTGGMLNNVDIRLVTP